METKDYLHFLVHDIHTVILSVTDEEGHPTTSAIDMMDSDGESLYFLTGKGKSLYARLKKDGYVSLTGLKGEDTMSSVSVSLSGRVRELGYDKIPELFEKNSYMYNIFPGETSKYALTVFQIYDGVGEWFDLSKKPIERDSFAFGGAAEIKEGYVVTDKCTGCKKCLPVCPQNCISADTTPVLINRKNCLYCGNCFNACPCGAVKKL